jgi:hypothetical protein
MLSSSAGSATSLLGAGVKDELEEPKDGLLLGLIETVVGVETGRSGTGVEEVVLGVFWKNPRSVFCPAEDVDFFNEGVFATGVDAGFLAMFEQVSAKYLLTRNNTVSKPNQINTSKGGVGYSCSRCEIYSESDAGRRDAKRARVCPD